MADPVGDHEHPSPLCFRWRRVSYRSHGEHMPNVLKQQEGAADERWLDAAISRTGGIHRKPGYPKAHRMGAARFSTSHYHARLLSLRGSPAPGSPCGRARRGFV